MPKTTRKHPDALRFGTIINRLRTERGWTLAKLAQRTGMNATYLGVLEKGGNLPSLITLLELAEVLNVPASEIIRELEEKRKFLRRPAGPVAEPAAE